jgi:hypothetical protein
VVEEYEVVLVILSKTMETVMDFMCCEESLWMYYML